MGSVNATLREAAVALDASRGDASRGDVSGGDVSGGDVSGGDVSGGDVSGGGTARLDAELLMAGALGVSRSEMLLRHMSAPAPAAFAALLARRLAHEPVAYILGQTEFHGLTLAVTPAVLIPRGDSESLIAAARQAFAARGVAPAYVLDLGTGSGCLLLAALALWPQARGLGLDRSDAALHVARGNAAHLGLAGRADFALRDWREPGWMAGLEAADLILANPPYVETTYPLPPDVRDYEPAGALFAGEDGLDDDRLLVPSLPRLLAAHGLAFVEIGDRQAEAVGMIAREAGLTCRLHHDLGGRPRAVELACKISLGISQPGP